MTIKELETNLGVPRANIRFYEREGLLSPKREENGYRDYSPEDFERLKKILILRKIGIPVGEIADLFDGAASLADVLEENTANLQKQMDELRGAMHLSEMLKESGADISSLDADRYWNVIEEEEKLGHKFMTVAKDIAKTEQGVIADYFGWSAKDGNASVSWWVILRNAVIGIAGAGCILCLVRGKWTLANFRDGALGICAIMAVEAVLSVPLYFLGKKHPWIAEHRKAALYIAALILCAVLLVLDNVVGA